MNSKTTALTQQAPSTMPSRATREGTLSLAEGIVSGGVSLVALERNVSLQTALASPIFRSAFRGNDATGYGVAHVLCKRFLNSFSFSTKLEPAQVESFTVDALERFEYETLDDMVLFFKMARSGKFGTAKKGIDSNLVFGDWFPKYMEQKAEARERQTQADKVAKTTTPVTMEDVKKTYAKATEAKKEDEMRRHIDHLTATFDRQMLEDTITSWEKQPALQRALPYLKRKRLTIK